MEEIFARTLEVVSDTADVPPELILSKDRHEEVVDARCLLIFLLYAQGIYPSCMKTRDEATGKAKKLEPWSKQEVEDMLKRNGVTIENDKGYDCVYVANMLKADFYKKSIADEAHLCQHIKLYMDDVDGYEGLPFTRFVADCMGSGNPIMWEDMLEK